MITDVQMLIYFAIVIGSAFCSLAFVSWLFYARSKGRKLSRLDISILTLFVSIFYGFLINMYTRFVLVYYPGTGEAFRELMQTVIWRSRYLPMTVAMIMFCYLIIKRMKLSLSKKDDDL